MLGRFLPSHDTIKHSRLLRWLGPRVHDPLLWHFNRRAVARGVAVGTFWAFVIPAAQVVVAAAHCTWWRANIPVAAAMTMVTNPLTISFWLWLAYQVGALVLGEPLAAAAPQGVGTIEWLSAFGWPTLLGMGLFAVGGAAGGYLGVKLFWRLRVWARRRTRRKP